MIVELWFATLTGIVRAESELVGVRSGGLQSMVSVADFMARRVPIVRTALQKVSKRFSRQKLAGKRKKQAHVSCYLTKACVR